MKSDAFNSVPLASLYLPPESIQSRPIRLNQSDTNQACSYSRLRAIPLPLLYALRVREERELLRQPSGGEVVISQRLEKDAGWLNNRGPLASSFPQKREPRQSSSPKTNAVKAHNLPPARRYIDQPRRLSRYKPPYTDVIPACRQPAKAYYRHKAVSYLLPKIQTPTRPRAGNKY